MLFQKQLPRNVHHDQYYPYFFLTCMQNKQDTIFRIIQQACENSLKHAQCKNILIQGKISSDFIILNVTDDGVGFDVDEDNDFSQFLENHNYGIVGMFERAHLIGAKLHINSELGSGTIISFNWKK